MWTTNISRQELISLTQGEQLRDKILRSVAAFSEIETSSQSLIGIWAEKPDDWKLPNLLLIQDSERRDFFAWANSYVKIKPITAFIRVIDFATLDRIASYTPDNVRWQRPILGLILGEALTYVDQLTAKLSIKACLGTYSFAVGRSMLKVEGVKGLTTTGQNWFRSREALGNRASKLPLVDLERVWSVIEQLIEPTSKRANIPQSVVRSSRDLFDTGDITDADWRELTKDTRLYELRLVMQDTREERVKLLEEFLKSIPVHVRADVELAFLVGYLVSMIAPGTLDHWRLLSPVRNSIPTAGIWYGLCAGLRPSSGLSSYGGGVGRLIGRELRRKVDILEDPTCDISVEELDVTGPFFKTEGTHTGNTVEVEVSPGVSVPIRANGLDQSLPEFQLPANRSSVEEPPIDPVTIDILDDAIYALQDVRRNLQKAIPYSQRGFFKKPRKKRPAR